MRKWTPLEVPNVYRSWFCIEPVRLDLRHCPTWEEFHLTVQSWVQSHQLSFPPLSLLTETNSPTLELSSFLWFPDTLLILQYLQLVFLCLVLGFLFLQTLMCTLSYSLGGSSSLFLVAHTLESFHPLQLPAMVSASAHFLLVVSSLFHCHLKPKVPHFPGNQAVFP